MNHDSQNAAPRPSGRGRGESIPSGAGEAFRTNGRRGYQLAFVDLDDTLLGPDKQISPENLAALVRLRSAGVQVVVASGRHHKNIVSIEKVGQPGWILSSHGSVVRHEQTGEVLLEMTMDPALVEKVCQRGREMGMSLMVYHREGAFMERATSWTDLYAREAGWCPRQADFRSLPKNGFQKVLWAENPDIIKRVAPELRREFSGQLNVVETNPELLEFFAPAANKATGAKALIGKLRIAPEQTLAFGDGNNDVEILQWAGLSVAMDHGRESARKAARFVSPPGPPESAFARAVGLVLAH